MNINKNFLIPFHCEFFLNVSLRKFFIFLSLYIYIYVSSKNREEEESKGGKVGGTVKTCRDAADDVMQDTVRQETV